MMSSSEWRKAVISDNLIDMVCDDATLLTAKVGASLLPCRSIGDQPQVYSCPRKHDLRNNVFGNRAGCQCTILPFRFSKTTTFDSIFVCSSIVVFALWFSLFEIVVSADTGTCSRNSKPSLAFRRSIGELAQWPLIVRTSISWRRTSVSIACETAAVARPVRAFNWLVESQSHSFFQPKV